MTFKDITLLFKLHFRKMSTVVDICFDLTSVVLCLLHTANFHQSQRFTATALWCGPMKSYV